MTLVTNQRAHDLTGAAMAAVKKGSISLHAPAGSLAQDEAKVYTVDAENTTVTSVSIPVGGDYSMLSNLTVVFDKGGNIVQYGETLISENEAGNFNITSYADGRLAKSNDTDQAFMTDAQLQNNSSPARVSTSGVGETVACVVSVLGVSGAVAYLIVGACAGACTVPIVGTAICVACIGAYAAVGGASITAVASCF